LYQQRPAPEEGLVFQKERFRYYKTLPENLNYYIGYDPGVHDHGDPTSMQVWGVDEMARLYLVDRWYDQCSMDVWIKQLLDWVRMFRPYEAVSESGVIRRAAEPWIKRAQQQQGVFFNQTWVTRSANKEAMAASAIAMVNSGQVYVPDNSVGWNFVDMCLKFPASSDDHDVDAFANLCLRLENLWEASPPRQQAKKSVIIDGTFGGEPLKVKQFMPPRFPKKRSRWKR
jgi:predicted phage terminase large subunit-like protein